MMKYLALKRTVSFWLALALLLALFAYASVPREMKAQSSPICFFQHTGFSGTSYCSGTGNFGSMPSGWNDYISSVRVTSGYSVVLYQHGNFTGTTLTLTADEPNLVNRGFNDIVSSYKITSNSGGSCTYQNWQHGASYSPVGTIVRHTNGNYYKLVNVGASGTSDGTDPTVSTWYWQPTTCSGGTAPPPPSGGSGLAAVLSEAQFNQMFPNRSSFYTYSGLITAAGYYHAFATTGSDTTKKQEVAAFLGNVDHESDSLRAVREYNTANYGSYCDWSKSYGCPAGQAAYYGRGPIQLTWNFNYYTAGQSMGVDLLNNPDQVATNAAIAWRTGLWYWMNGTGNAGMTPHNAIINGYGFGMTIQAINGSLECGGKRPAEVQRRVDAYTRFAGILGVATGSNLYC